MRNVEPAAIPTAFFEDYRRAGFPEFAASAEIYPAARAHAQLLRQGVIHDDGGHNLHRLAV